MLQIFKTVVSKYISTVTLYVCIGTDQLTTQRIEHIVQSLPFPSKKHQPHVDRNNPHKLSVNNKFMSLAKQQKRPWSKTKQESNI